MYWLEICLGNLFYTCSLTLPYTYTVGITISVLLLKKLRHSSNNTCKIQFKVNTYVQADVQIYALYV